ncbi:helix-turn-helix transcriptional regulator [Aquidulcibacter sp.]|uniref:helix-turn-helix transcriptional regulator n=1 Tax=Aquidulcibacter sp. TaxID=2052990 RepID=UPI003BA5CD24
MAKRKPEPAHSAQMDMFGGWSEPANQQTSPIPIAVTLPVVVEVSNDQVEPSAESYEGVVPLSEVEAEKALAIVAASSIKEVPSIPVARPDWEHDEWWTTAMVCAYLKLGRKAVWERTRKPTIGFPQPRHFGSCRHRWRAAEVRAWALGH